MNAQTDYDRAYKLVQDSTISPADKNKIFELIIKLFANGISKRRAIKYLINLRLILERQWLPSYHNV
ncbi:MAG: hypothetical protein KAR07_05500, partial [Spirochaetes bacterium]|nr:hypothetical protein [Spirochaetota bacterium]